MKVDELMNSTREALTVRRVFGEPYEKDGLAVIPAAWVRVEPAGAPATTRRANRVRAAASA